ncbi:hypothetical protein [Catellatospora sichuanensis]|uniref:hypothetical protein n=1 Tax=Catellatospora sichuanensis TaxID=1969805 RepID=UPI001FEA57C0|nr:hypothetical protein [Catellatospora sichuanensis]
MPGDRESGPTPGRLPRAQHDRNHADGVDPGDGAQIQPDQDGSVLAQRTDDGLRQPVRGVGVLFADRADAQHPVLTGQAQ